MDVSNLYLTLFALFLVFLNGFFVASEFAIVKLRLTKAEELAVTHGVRGRVLFSIRTHLDAYLSACQLGITLASLGLGWIGEPAFAALIEPALAKAGVGSPAVIHGTAFALAFGTISYLHIVLGELAPKSIAIRKTEPASLWTAVPLYAFYWAMYPFIWVLNGSANWLLRRMGVDMATEGEEAHSLQEIRKVLASSHIHGELGRESADLLEHAIQLDELTAGDLMRPEREMMSLDLNASVDEQIATMRAHRYSRFPVHEGDVQHPVGILHVKDLLGGFDENTDLRALIRPVLMVEEHMSATSILQKFRDGAPHFAIVSDEYGALVGFITLDHVLESLLGPINDEFRHRRPAWKRQADGSWTGDGALPIFSLERLLDVEIDAHDVNSVGGLLIRKLDRIPVPGDVCRFDGFEVEVQSVDGATIGKVTVRKSIQ